MESLLQTKHWAQFKSSHGWISHTIHLPALNKEVSVLERPIGFNKSFLYAPEVDLTQAHQTDFEFLAKAAKKLSSTAIFFRLELLEPLGETENSVVVALTKCGYRKAFEEIQPEHRQWIDISGDEATILSSMKEKGRYNVRLSDRKGVEVRISTDTTDVEVFYKIFEETGRRDGFKIRSLGYFRGLCEMLFDKNLGELVIAEHEGEALAAMIVTYYDGLASYLYGASTNHKRNLMAPYAAHFKAIQSAKKRGCHTYDLLQVAPLNADSRHHYANLTRFKQQFGGKQVDLVGGWDYVFQPLWYTAFRTAEKLRRH